MSTPEPGPTRRSGWAPMLPLLAAVVAAALLPLGGLAAGALLGLGAFVGLLLAGRPLSLPFAGWTFGAAVALGFMAGVLANLVGLSVNELLARGEGRHGIALTLAIAAVMLFVLGLLIAAASMLGIGVAPAEDESAPPR